MNKKFKIISIAIFLIIFGWAIFGTDFFKTETASASWYSSGGTWTYRKSIVVDNQKVSATSSTYLLNFPMLVSEIDPDLKYTSSGDGVASSTGGDIIFTSESGTLLDFEIEKYASTTGELVAWVKIPFLSSTSTTPIYMYYGNAAASYNQNPSGVWDSNYKGVWHMKEDPTATAAGPCVSSATKEVCDSTSAHNDADSNGTMTSADQVSGKNDGSIDFDNSNDYLAAANESNFDFSSTFTLEAWYKKATSTPAGDYIVSKPAATYYNAAFTLALAGDPSLYCNFYTGSTWVGMNVNGLFDADTNWHHVVCGYNITNKTGYLYVDGALVSTKTWSTGTPSLNNNAVLIGTGGTSANQGQFYGQIDEVRISNNYRPESLAITSYNNQSSPKTFYSYGAEDLQYRPATTAGAQIRGGVNVRGNANFH